MNILRNVIIGLITGATVGVVTGSLLTDSNFKTGDCVKVLGYDFIAKVTATSPSGGIELTIPNSYNKDNPIVEGYTKQNQELFVKVNCN